jgi:hypothetical protein
VEAGNVESGAFSEARVTIIHSSKHLSESIRESDLARVNTAQNSLWSRIFLTTQTIKRNFPVTR